MIASQLDLFKSRKSEKLPDDFWLNHITSTFVETLRWWIENGMSEPPELITEYFYLSVFLQLQHLLASHLREEHGVLLH